jgi:lipoate-protein ligase A
MKTNSITRKFGKMLRLDVTFEDHIETIKITGDFFLHPEDTLDQIVDQLIGISLPIQKELIVAQLNSIVEAKKAELIGITVQNIVDTLDEVTQ